MLAASEIETVDGRRGGLAGLLDGIRRRAEAALGEGTDPAAASLLRGFVLGQDDRIDEATVDEFKASGLAHLLAVSGQNVVLLAVLAAVVLAVLGVPLRSRLAWILVLIAIYVPVAGAGASIQRAGVMGAAGIVAALAGRPRSRWYALLLAAGATLALDPRASADVGWQLSFAAVAGILLASAPLADALAGGAGGLATGARRRRRADRRGDARDGAPDGPPLRRRLGRRPAGQPGRAARGRPGDVARDARRGRRTARLAAGRAADLARRAARRRSSPRWRAGSRLRRGRSSRSRSRARSRSPSPTRRSPPARRSRCAGSGGGAACGRRRGPGGPPRTRRRLLAGAAGLILAGVAIAANGSAGPGGPAGAVGLRMTLLDVGQGDSILLEPAGAEPVLVDAGPAEAEVAEQLDRLGVERLAALVITHPEADHDGGAADVLGRIPTDRLVFARARPATIAAARAAGARPARVRRRHALAERPPAARGRSGRLPTASPRRGASRRRIRTRSRSCWSPAGAASRRC